MKNSNFRSFILGITLLLIAAALILESLGLLTFLTTFAGGLSVPRIILCTIVICIAVVSIRRSKTHFIWYLAILFMLLESNIAHLCGRTDPNLINNWLLLLCTLLIDIALHLLFGNHKITFKQNSHISGHIGIGKNTVYIDCSDFHHKHIENDLGSTAVYFTNIESYQGGAHLLIENNLGQTTVSIPASWSLSLETENNLGHIDNPQNGGDPNGPTLYIDAENNLGRIEIRFV